MNLLDWLLHGTIPVAGGGAARRREVVGNLFGLASAVLGMRRMVWAWPVGLVGNVLLFTVFVTGELSAAPWPSRSGARPVARSSSPRSPSTAGGAGRSRAAPVVPPTAERSRRAGRPGRARGCSLVLGVVGYAVAYAVLLQIGSWGPTTEAWILAGSMLATYGMARGWVEFWLVWILVDIVGVTTLVKAGFYPTAGMYLVYGVLRAWSASSSGCAPASAGDARPPTRRRQRDDA